LEHSVIADERGGAALMRRDAETHGSLREDAWFLAQARGDLVGEE
jgi:hypothetical protein